MTHQPMRLELPLPSAERYAGGGRRCPEDQPLSNALRAAMDVLGVDFGHEAFHDWRLDRGHVYFMGVTGEAFTFVWLPRDPAAPPNDANLETPGLEARCLRALASAGFAGEMLLPGGPAGPDWPGDGPDAAALQTKVARALARGLPAIAFGIPEGHQLLLVAGCDETGDALSGWVAEPGGAGITFAPEKRVAVPGGCGRAKGIILFTGRRPRPSDESVYLEALREGLKLLRAASVGSYHAGFATFDAGAWRLVAASAGAVESSHLFDPMVWDLAERRWYGSLFLTRAAGCLPHAAEPLRAAAECFQAEHDLMHEANRAAGGRWPGDATPRLGDLEARRRIAEIIRQARARDEEAALQIATVLDATG